jgi:carboxylesterase
VYDVSSRAKLGSYRRYPYYAVHQLFSLVEHVRDDLPEVVQPILIMHAHKDHTIPFSNSELLVQWVGSKEKFKVDLHKSYHVITADSEKEVVMREVLSFIKKYT